RRPGVQGPVPDRRPAGAERAGLRGGDQGEVGGDGGGPEDGGEPGPGDRGADATGERPEGAAGAVGGAGGVGPQRQGGAGLLADAPDDVYCGDADPPAPQ